MGALLGKKLAIFEEKVEFCATSDYCMSWCFGGRSNDENKSIDPILTRIHWKLYIEHDYWLDLRFFWLVVVQKRLRSIFSMLRSISNLSHSSEILHTSNRSGIAETVHYNLQAYRQWLNARKNMYSYMNSFISCKRCCLLLRALSSIMKKEKTTFWAVIFTPRIRN